MAEEVTRIVEDVDRLFSEIVVNGESHTSNRYVLPKEETTPVSHAVAEENRESVTVTRTVENIDKLFSSIVVNGDEHVSERYVAPNETSVSAVPEITEEETIGSQGEVEENREPVTVTKTVENIDKLFSSVVVNGDEHVSERYVAPVTTPEVSQQNIPTEPQQQASANTRSIVGADVYAVELNNILHNFADRVLTQMLANIEALIPNQASPQNQLADKNFVNSSIATNTANFLGTYTSLADIQAIPNPTNNDYAYLETTDQAGNTLYDRYKYSGEDEEWLFEYELNNSSFTAEQWATINSGLTQQSVDDDIQEAIAGIELNSDYSRQGAYCDTAGSEQAKVAKMVGYALQDGQDFPITFVNANTYAGKITLSINGTTACDVYLKGSVSSSSNYTLPSGTYILHYENSKYYIETDWGVPFARIANSAQSCSGNSATATSATSATTAKRLQGNTIANIRIGSAQAKISLSQLMTWLINTKGYIPSGVNCYVNLQTPWSYAGNDILQLTINGVNYELQLAGCIIEFMGTATSYNAGVFRLRIHSSPTTAFTVSSGYIVFPTSRIAEYTCNDSGFSPTWRIVGTDEKYLNGYWGLTDPYGADNVWIRTTSQGIIPYQSGGRTAGHNYLGTSSWYFAYGYIQNMYVNKLNLSSVAGTENGDIWIV